MPLHGCAEMARKEGKLKKAETLLKRSISLSETCALKHKQSSDHASVIYSHAALADTYRRLGEHRKADESRTAALCLDLGIPLSPVKLGVGVLVPNWHSPHVACARETQDFVRPRAPFLPTPMQVQHSTSAAPCSAGVDGWGFFDQFPVVPRWSL